MIARRPPESRGRGGALGAIALAIAMLIVCALAVHKFDPGAGTPLPPLKESRRR